MKPATSFADILALRGRIVLFTPSLAVGQRFEAMAERLYATVIRTRGWADKFGPLSQWQRVHTQRDFGLFSTDQRTYLVGLVLPCTDIVWCGDTGDQLHTLHIHQAFVQAMSRGDHMEEPPRKWLIAEDAL